MYDGGVTRLTHTPMIRRAPGGRRRQGRGASPRPLRAALLAGLLVAAAASSVGCAPQAQPPMPDAKAAQAAATTAEVIYHRMAIGFLETGAYTTNVLVDVTLPAGTRWTLADYPADGSSYVLLITSDSVSGVAWRVSPDGVRRVATN